MVKVSDLRGQAPEVNGAWTTSLQELQELIGPKAPSISTHLHDVRSTFGVDAKYAFKRTQELLLAKRSWGGFGVASHQISGFQPTAVPTFRPTFPRKDFASVWATVTDHAINFHLPVVRFPTVAKPMGFELSPDVVEWIRARKSLKQGDVVPFWQFVENQLERSPDGWLREVLEQHYLPYGADIPTPWMLEFLRHHKERLETPSQKEWYTRKLVIKVEGQLSKNMQHDLMRSLESYGASKAARREGLRENLPSVLAEAEAGGYFFTEGRYRNVLLKEVEKRVVAENRLLRQTRRQEGDKEGNELYKIVSLRADTLEDEFDPYAGVENTLLLDSLIARSGLSKSESEVLGLFRRGLTPEHIASQRGVTRKAIDSHLFNIRKKLRSVS